MSRDISLELKEALFAQQTDEVAIALVTITHADLDDVIRVNSSGEDIVSNGELFLALPFRLTLPDDTEKSAYRAKISIDNVDQEIVRAVRRMSSAPAVAIQIIKASAPDVVEASFADFNMTNISFDRLRVEGELTLEELDAEPFPANIFSPSITPGLF